MLGAPRVCVLVTNSICVVLPCLVYSYRHVSQTMGLSFWAWTFVNGRIRRLLTGQSDVAFVEDQTSLARDNILSRATSHGAPSLRWPEDGEEGNGGTPSPGVIEHPRVGMRSTARQQGQSLRAALLAHADYPLHLNPLGLLNY